MEDHKDNKYDKYIHDSPEIAGHGFLTEIPFYATARQLFDQAGVASEKFITEGALRVHWSMIRDLASDEYKELLALPNPVILRSGYHEFEDEMLDLPKEKYMRFLEDFGSRFIGIHGIHERMGGVAWAHPVEKIIEEIKAKTGLEVSNPTNRHECYKFMKILYQALTQKDYYKVYSTHAAPVDHFLYENGLALCSAEIGAFMPCTSMQMSSLRGAARQYGRPWGVCLTAWTLNNGNADHTNYSFPDPGSQTAFSEGSGWSQGPLMGPSLSLQKRNLYLAYMSGATLISHESDCNYTQKPHLPGSRPESILVAHYPGRDAISDPNTGSLSARYLSPFGEIYKDFYDRIVTKHDRGVSYAPVGIILDEYHGYNAAYDTEHLLLSDVPYERRDHMIRALVNTIYPWEDKQRGPGNNMENQIMVSGPYGDVIDFLTINADAKLLQKYPVIILAGKPEISEQNAIKLKDHVRSGGTVIANTKQLCEYLSTDFFGCTTDGSNGSGAEVTDTATGKQIEERGSFVYDKVKLTDGRSLFTTMQGGSEYPVALQVDRGSGKAILFTPHWTMPSDSKNSLLDCFGRLLGSLVKELLPASVMGDVEYMFSRSKTGWVLTLFNNNGVVKAAGMHETIDSEKEVCAVISWDGSSPLSGATQIREWMQEKSYTARSAGNISSIEVPVPAGNLRIIEFSI